MQFDADTISSSGQITTSADRVRVIEFHARSGNTKPSVVGISTVSSERGREVPAGESVTYNFTLAQKDGSVPFNIFYAHLESGDLLDYSVIKE